MRASALLWEGSCGAPWVSPEGGWSEWRFAA